MKFKDFYNINEGQIEKGKTTTDSIIKRLNNKTIIVFDTETTGLAVKEKFTIVSEVAAQAYDSKGKILGTYHKKSKLTKDVYDRMNLEDKILDNIKKADEWNKNSLYGKADAVKYGKYMGGKFEGTEKLWVSKSDTNKNQMPSPKNKHWSQWEPGRKTIKDLLKMTGYDDKNTQFEDLKDVLIGFKKWVESYKNPILVAHNANFDMYQVNNGLELIDKKQRIKTEVLDTLAVVQQYLIPMLLVKSQNGDQKAKKAIQVLSAGGKKPKANLGVLGKMFNVKTKMWHSGIADVMQLAGVLFKMMDYFRKNK